MSISHVDDGQLHAYLDGELPQAEQWRLEAHLGECPACRGRLEEQRALIARASELLALATPPARDAPPFRPAMAQPPPPVRWPARQPLAWAATVVLALAAGWYLRGESPSAPVRPDRRAAAANAAAPRETARTVPPSPRQAPEPKTLAQQAPPAGRPVQEADEAARSVAAAQHDQMISGSALPNPQMTPLDQAARAKSGAVPPAAALAAPAAPSAVRWETISWDTARAILGVDPARIPNLPAVAKRSSAADRVVLVEQQLASGTVVRLHERPAAEGAPGMEVGTSERLARYVGNLRVEIEGALPPDSLSKLLELVK